MSVDLNFGEYDPGSNVTATSQDFIDLNNPAGDTSNNYTIPGSYTVDASGNKTTTPDYAGFQKFLSDNKSLITAGGAALGLMGGNNPKYGKTGYQGTIPNLMATRNMISAPPTKEMGYRPGAGGIDYGGDVTYTRLADGVDPFINLRGNTGTLAGANLKGATVTPPVKPPVKPPILPPVTPPVTPPVNLGSKGYQTAIAAGLTPAQYLNSINQWIIDNPNATRAQIDAALKAGNVSQTDLQEALRTSTFSDATKYALTHGGSFEQQAQIIEKWLRENPYATADQIQKAMDEVGLNDEDIARGMYGPNVSAAKEYAVVHDMGLDKLYQNILDYQAAGHSKAEVAAVMDKYGIQKQDIDAANKYAAETGYKADPTSYAGVGNYSNLAEGSGGGLDKDNEIYKYFADPKTQAALASGDTRGIAETMQELGYSPAEVAAATGTNVADVQSAYDAALSQGDTSSSDSGSSNSIYDYFASPDVQAALASGDVSDVLGTISDAGWSAADIAAATGVSEASVQAQIDAASGYAQGGEIAMAKGHYLQGGTDGMADELPARIGKDQPAALSHGEFVIPADVVSHMGNGNSDAGAKKLYQMMDKIRMARTGNKKQGKKINPDKFMPGGLASAYAKGGSVKHFVTGGATVPAGTTGVESSLSNWAGNYTTNMLGQGQALANMPYQAYMGPLTAGSSPLQDTAFTGLAGLKTPSSIGDAATTAGNYANRAGMMSYTPQTMDFLGNQNRSGLTYLGGPIQGGLQIQQPPTSAGPGANYGLDMPMVSYSPFTEEGRRKIAEAGERSKARGVTATDQEMRGFDYESQGPKTEDDWNRFAAQVRFAPGTDMEKAKADFFTGTQSGSPASFTAPRTDAMPPGGDYAVSPQQGGIASLQPRQTSQQPSNIAQQYMNPYLQSALNPQLEEARRQSLITQQQNAGKMTQAGAFGGSRQAILDAENQRNLGTNLSKITGEGYNTAYNKAMEQFNADQARKMAEGQFGATYGLDALKTGITGAQTQGNLGTQQSQADINTLNAQLAGGNVQRGIESEGIAADKAQFEEARANPYKMVQFQQSLLQGLPLDAKNYSGIQPSDLTKAAQGATTVAQLLKNLGISV
jgi:hypothetical protein